MAQPDEDNARYFHVTVNGPQDVSFSVCILALALSTHDTVHIKCVDQSQSLATNFVFYKEKEPQNEVHVHVSSSGISDLCKIYWVSWLSGMTWVSVCYSHPISQECSSWNSFSLRNTPWRHLKYAS